MDTNRNQCCRTSSLSFSSFKREILKWVWIVIRTCNLSGLILDLLLTRNTFKCKWLVLWAMSCCSRCLLSCPRKHNWILLKLCSLMQTIRKTILSREREREGERQKAYKYNFYLLWTWADYDLHFNALCKVCVFSLHTSHSHTWEVLWRFYISICIFFPSLS